MDGAAGGGDERHAGISSASTPALTADGAGSTIESMTPRSDPTRESLALERLSAADASNIELDAPDQVNAFLLAGILGAGGFVAADGTADLDRLRTVLAERLGERRGRHLQRFGQRVDVTRRPLVWEPCEPDLTWHVRLADAVDGRDSLADLAARLMTVPLPLDRPLWELLVVPGAAPRGVGIVLRLHHCVADGVHGVRLVQDLFGDLPVATTPAPRPAPPAPARRRRPSPRAAAGSALRSLTRVSAIFRATVPRTVLLGPIGPRRAVTFTQVDVARLASAARRSGATVNDALLASVAVAVEAALHAAGEPVPAVLPASVPVALPARGSSGNAVGVMLVPLITGEPDAGARLAAIAAATRTAKEEARAQGTFELTRTRWGSRAFAWLARRQRFIALFVTNVRGPDEPLAVAGAPLLIAWPVAPIQGNVRVGVAAMSYAGRLGVALHGDAEAVRVAVAGRTLADELARIAEG